VSDNLKLSHNNLRKVLIGLYIDILQQKTKKAVTFGVAEPLVIEILENEFPRTVSQIYFIHKLKHFADWRGLINW
jgi:hypothetical protein